MHGIVVLSSVKSELDTLFKLPLFLCFLFGILWIVGCWIGRLTIFRGTGFDIGVLLSTSWLTGLLFLLLLFKITAVEGELLRCNSSVAPFLTIDGKPAKA